jgi:glycyl-tRNA synthetase
VVSAAVEALAEQWTDFEPIATALETDGKTTVDGFEITTEMVSWTKATKKIHEIKFTPSVIEPSFGMGRILYSLLEHSFYQRDGDEQRCVMRFNPVVAPEKCAVLPISANPECNAVVDSIAAELVDADLATRVDKSSAALGRRYARTDELGVPFAVTVDFQSLQDRTVTMRERDSMVQIRLAQGDVTNVIHQLVHRRTTWEQLCTKYPVVTVDDGEGGGNDTSLKVSEPTKIVTTSRGTFRVPTDET